MNNNAGNIDTSKTDDLVDRYFEVVRPGRKLAEEDIEMIKKAIREGIPIPKKYLDI